MLNSKKVATLLVLLMSVIVLLGTSSCSSETLSIPSAETSNPMTSVDRSHLEDATVTLNRDSTGVDLHAIVTDIYGDEHRVERICNAVHLFELNIPKGISYTQKEFTNHVNLKSVNSSKSDTLSFNQNGWKGQIIVKTTILRHQSLTNPEDFYEEIITHKNLIGLNFSDPKGYSREVRKFDDISLTLKRVKKEMSHHLNENILFKDGEWSDTPWRVNDVPAEEGYKVNGVFSLRYAKNDHIKAYYGDVLIADQWINNEYIVPFNEAEALEEGGEVSR